MNGINNMILLILVVACLAIIAMKYREQFVSTINPEDHVTDDLQNKELIDVQDMEYREFLNNLVDQLLGELNRLYNKSLMRINLERAEKTVGEGKDHYVVFAFVLNSGKNSVAKLRFDFDVDQNDHVVVKKVDVMGSRPSLFKNRHGVTTRFPVDFKTSVDGDTLVGENMLPSTLESMAVEFKETPHKMVDRNKNIVPKEREAMGDVDTFPSKKVLGVWDQNGVEITQCEPDNLGGLNHGTRQLTLVPQFFKSNFESCEGNYLWLFDTAEDVISHPIGIG